jgi:hypothetical protein
MSFTITNLDLIPKKKFILENVITPIDEFLVKRIWQVHAQGFILVALTYTLSIHTGKDLVKILSPNHSLSFSFRDINAIFQIALFSAGVLSFSVAGVGVIARNVINRFTPKNLSNFTFLVPTIGLILSPTFNASILLVGCAKNIYLLAQAILKK